MLDKLTGEILVKRYHTHGVIRHPVQYHIDHKEKDVQKAEEYHDNKGHAQNDGNDIGHLEA